MNHHCKTVDEEMGFTLVELLVVIGIIAILTAIAVPMFLSQRQKANSAAGLRSDIRNVAHAMETWYAENPNGVMPPQEGRTGWSLILLGEDGTFVNQGLKHSTEFPDGFVEPPLNKGTSIGVVARGNLDSEGGPGNFCILGNMKDSQFELPTGVTYYYVNSLFYDSAKGGVHTAETLPDNGACYRYHKNR